MKSANPFFIFLAAVFMLTACKDQVNFKKTKSGVPYKIFSSGKEKDTIAVGNIVKFHMIQRVKGNGKVKDSVLTITYGKMAAYKEVTPGTGSYGDPLMDILTKAKKGDSIYITQVMDSFIAHQPEIVTNTPFRKGDNFITTIKIVDVFKTGDLAQADYDKMSKDDAAKAEKALEKYLADNKIQAKKTAGGVYMQVITPGQGPKPDSGQYVTVKYKGTHLSGEPFDEGIYPMQLGVRASIAGFEEAIKNMQKGEKAKVYVPSALAYGPRGNGQAIGPNENLIFEMTLQEISNTAPPPPPQLQPNTDPTQQRR